MRLRHLERLLKFKDHSAPFTTKIENVKKLSLEVYIKAFVACYVTNVWRLCLSETFLDELDINGT